MLMGKILVWLGAFLTLGLVDCPWSLLAQSDPATVSSTVEPAKVLSTGWTLLKEGEAEGTVEPDAKHPQRDSPHLLHIAVTKTAAPGKGRAGATNSTAIEVRQGCRYEVTFSAITEKRSVGLVFSLESADGQVLARSTLPEIGRGRNFRGAEGEGDGANWPKYSVTLNVRASDPKTHLTITPIEPTSVWLDDVTISTQAAAR